jgi:hypothetical protein
MRCSSHSLSPQHPQRPQGAAQGWAYRGWQGSRRACHSVAPFPYQARVRCEPHVSRPPHLCHSDASEVSQGCLQRLVRTWCAGDSGAMWAGLVWLGTLDAACPTLPQGAIESLVWDIASCQVQPILSSYTATHSLLSRTMHTRGRVT